MIRLRTAAAIPLAALAFAGCGGDDKPSKEDFVANADKICKDLDQKGEELGQSEPDNAEELAKLAGDLRKTAEDGRQRVEELEVPEGEDGKKAQEWKDAVKSEAEGQLLPAVEDLEKAAKANDQKGIVEAAQKVQQADSDKSDKLAEELGMKECGD